jgi:hypothetical protein
MTELGSGEASSVQLFGTPLTGIFFLGSAGQDARMTARERSGTGWGEHRDAAPARLDLARS